MDKLKILEIKKLLKELDYIESDFEYRSEVISDADSEFINSVNNFLSLHPELKEIYDQKITDKINESIKKSTEETEETEDNIEEDGEDVSDLVDEDERQEVEEVEEDRGVISPKIKKLYREIVKITHPDKVKKKKLNDIYIKATDFYNLNDKIGIYKICNELSINYDIEEDDELFISMKISSLKKRIVFLETTFTWKWTRTENEEERNQILINYIKLRIQ
jgi:hypothetical protein